MHLCTVCTGMTVYHWSEIRQTLSRKEYKLTETLINLTSQVSVCMLCVGVYICSDLV